MTPDTVIAVRCDLSIINESFMWDKRLGFVSSFMIKINAKEVSIAEVIVNNGHL